MRKISNLMILVLTIGLILLGSCKNNCNNSEIILTLDIIDKENSNINSNNNENKKKKSMDSYVIYIFLIIMILIIFFGYKWFMNFKDKNNDID